MKLQKTQPNISTDSNNSNIDSSNQTCYNCYAWRIFEGLQDVEDLAGECRLEPPILAYTEDGEPIFLWPSTTRDGWCARWHSKENHKALS